MTETITSANAASTLFLGHDGEWWDFWLIISVIAAALVATAVGVTTAGSIISHKREAMRAEEALDRYKIETGKQLAEANARQKEAELKLAQLRKLAGPREIDIDKLKDGLQGQPKAPVVIWYVPEVSDGYWFASRLFSALHMAGWEASWPQTIPELTKEDIEKVVPDAPGRLYSILRGQPPAMSAGGAAKWSYRRRRWRSYGPRTKCANITRQGTFPSVVQKHELWNVWKRWQPIHASPEGNAQGRSRGQD